MSKISDADWRINYLVSHPVLQEPQAMRERRVLQRISAMVEVNKEELGEKEVRKIQKVINARLLAILNEARPDAKTKP